MDEDINLHEIIVRLKEEKQKSKESLYESGRKEGYDWAAQANYDYLYYAAIIYANCSAKMEGLDREYYCEHADSDDEISFDPTNDKMLGEYFTEIMENNPMLYIESWGDVAFVPTELYLDWEDGWLDGVDEVWEKVKEEL